MDAERGQATIESTALAALIALLLVAVIALVASGGEVKAGRELAGVIGRRITCAPHLPNACDHEPVVPAYRWPLARPPGPGPPARGRAAAPPPPRPRPAAGAAPRRRRPAAGAGRLPSLPQREL